jgi:peptidoglycan hydrolase CwlO-like protein
MPVFFLFQKQIFAESSDNSDIKDSISSLEKKLDKEQEAKQRLEQALNLIQKSVSATQAEINKTQAYLKEAEENIARTEEEIKALGNKTIFQKKILESLLQEMYFSENKSVVDVVLSSVSLSEILGRNIYLLTLEQKVMNLIQDIKDTQGKISDDKQKLLETQEDQERLLALKKDQQQDLVADKMDTQGDIAEKEATIEELQQKLSQLRSSLSGFLGKSYDTKNIEDAAAFAAKASGVRKDFILGMLVVESDLGRFTGGCYAKDSRMSGNRLKIFKDICKSLDYDWKKRKVSCPPKGYKGTGGAMGVAQFMADTWVGYKSQIASVTGHNPPDPWNLTDGVTAMGLKLARGGATKKSGECNAAKLYLSGTTSSKYNWYCQKVLYWANNYEKLM